MLKIGTRCYELVRAHSGFFLELDPAMQPEPMQQWRLEAHFVSSPANALLPVEDDVEYLRLTVTADRYRISDWRELTGLGLEAKDDDEEDSRTFYGEGILEYMLGPEREPLDEPPAFPLIVGDMEVKRKEGYLFSCEFDATVKFDDGRREELSLEAELPFAGVSMDVPINGNAVAIALARARREIGPMEIADGRVIAHDWRLKERPEAWVDSTRRVLLRTPWW